MRPLSALLHRLRRFGAPPGRPAEVLGVPASPVEDAAAELGPLFAVLDDLEREADAVRDAARREVAALTARAQAEVERIRLDTERRAAAARAATTGAADAASEAEARAIAAAASVEAEAVERRAAERTPELVTRLLRTIEDAAP